MVAENNILNINSFLNKTFIQESNVNRYICPKCPQFGTESKSKYHQHLNMYHDTFTEITCIYCLMSFTCSQICTHIDLHFDEGLMSSNICRLCNQTVKMDCHESVFDHLLFQHNNVLCCPVCVNQFDDPSKLIDHIITNIRIVFHCNYENCSVKTVDKEELEFHKESCMHYTNDDFYYEEHVFDCLLHEESQKFQYGDDYCIENLLTDKAFSSESIDQKDPVPVQKSRNDFDEIILLNCSAESINHTFQNLGSEKIDKLKRNLLSVNLYFVGISYANSKRIFCCSSCNYVSPYYHSDIRKHIIMSHCGVSKIFVRQCLRIVKYETQETNSASFDGGEKFDSKDWTQIKPVSLNETVVIPNNEKSVENFDIHSVSSNESMQEVVHLVSRESSENSLDYPQFDYLLKLSFMEEAFQSIFSSLDSNEKRFIKNKLSEINRFSVGIILRKDKKLFYCLNCEYKSRYNHADIRKHICLIHLSVPSLYLRKCLKSINFSYEEYSVKSGTIVPNNPQGELSIVTCSKNQSKSSTTSPKADRSTSRTHSVILGKESQTTKRPGRKSTGKIFCGKGIWISKESIDQSNYVEEKSGKENHSGPFKIDLTNSTGEFDKEISLTSNPIIVGRDSNEKLSNSSVEKKSIKKTESRVSQGRLSTEESEKVRMKISECGGIIPMNYSEKVFQKLFRYESNVELVRNLKEKMDKFKSFSMKVTFLNHSKRFTCCYCQYESPHHQGDIKKHILAKHCGIKGDLLKECIRLCRVDSYFELLPDWEIINSINGENRERKAPLLSDLDEDECVVPKQKKHSKISLHDISKNLDNDSNLLQNSNSRINRKRSALASPSDTEETKRSQVEKPIVERRRKVNVSQEISLSYSETILKALCNIENISHRFQEIKNKMKLYCQISIRIGTSGTTTIYICSKCNWFTVKPISFVSGHIVHEHTGLAQSLQPLAAMCAKINHRGFLMSDEEISEMGWKNVKPILSQQTADNIFIDLTNY